MKTYVLASLIAASATGCIISSDNSTAAHVGATWQIKSVSGQTLGCPMGFDTAALVNQPVDSAGNNVGSPIIDLFDCAAGAGTSAKLPATTYSTWVQITDHSGANVYARSVPALLDVTDVDLTYNTDIYDDGGYFQLAWDLVGKNTNAPLTCAQAGVSGSTSGIDLLLNISGTMTMDMDQFPCDPGQGISKAFAAGSYTVSVDAYTSAGQVSDSVVKANQVISGPNMVTDLGTATIPITGM